VSDKEEKDIQVINEILVAQIANKPHPVILAVAAMGFALGLLQRDMTLATVAVMFGAAGSFWPCPPSTSVYILRDNEKIKII
jgi:hypothetical protein